MSESRKPRIIVTKEVPHGQGLAVSGKTCSWNEMIDYINAERDYTVWAVSAPENWYLVELMKRVAVVPINEVWVTPPASPGDTVFIHGGDGCWWMMKIEGGVK